MKIILDTNILQKDLLMMSSRFSILFDYIAKTKTKISFPRIVYDELEANYKRELAKNINIYIRDKKNLEKILLNRDIPDISIDIESESLSYMGYVLEKLGVVKREIFEYKEGYLTKVVKRSIQRKKPCSGTGEEIRDAILWHSVLDIADEDDDRTVVFISNNTNQFAYKENELHHELVEDCKRLKLNVQYHASLEDFLKKHAEPIDFIDKRWITSNIDTDTILNEIKNDIEKQSMDDLVPLLNENQSPTGYFNLVQWSPEVESFYVYKMIDNSIEIEIQYSGEAEIECEVESIARREFYDQNYEVMVSPSTLMGEELIVRNLSEVSTSFEYLYPQLYITAAVTIKNNKIEYLRVVDFQIG